ncbi:hypothetical protein AB0A77_26750 [Streptomyces varsoviensis]
MGFAAHSTVTVLTARRTGASHQTQSKEQVRAVVHLVFDLFE